MHLDAPHGPAWEFFLLFAVIVAGPWLVERARVPGIVGLLLGGFAIGPNGFGLISAGDQTIPDLGQLGLLYLMFAAGLELDLALLRVNRRPALVFAGLTFSVPFAGGVAVGLALGWELPAALLLGSLLASHTLVTYPLVRERGLAGDPAVASAVGATIITDTLALIVLAVVAGTVQGSGSGVQIGVGLAVGLAVLLATSFLLLPLVVRWSYRRLGRSRTVRFAVVITAMLAAASVAEVFGIEGIVGAFFAGLALNRLVPNEGPLMERVEFFGSAVLIPVFLVSVGFILNPRVLIQPETLALAGLFILACVGGKAIAAALTHPLLGFSGPQVGVAFALTTPQAAATLAATTVGFQIGLFSTTVVNAVLVLILVTMIGSPIAATIFARKVPTPDDRDEPLGARVLVAVEHAQPDLGLLRLAGRIADADAGVVYPILISKDGDPAHERGTLAALAKQAADAGLDSEPTLVVDRSLAHAVLHAAAARRATLVLVEDRAVPVTTPFGTWEEAVASAAPAPVVLVRGGGSMRQVRVAATPNAPESARDLAADLARRLGGADESAAGASQEPAEGDVLIVPTSGWELLDEAEEPAEGAVIMIVPPPGG